jgi:hypothetical protein
VNHNPVTNNHYASSRTEQTQNDILQDTHLIRHEIKTIANFYWSPLVVLYVGMDWGIGTNLGTETLNHSGAIDGYTSYIEFIPTKQIGAVVLCSCDETRTPQLKPNEGTKRNLEASEILISYRVVFYQV